MLKRILLLISIFSTSLFSQTPQGTYKLWADSLKVDSSGVFIDVTERVHTTYGKYLHSSAKDTIDAVIGRSPGFTLDVNSKAVISSAFLSDSLVAADTTALKLRSGSKDGSMIYLAGLSSTNSNGGGWFVYGDSTYLENGIVAYDAGVSGKQWVSLYRLTNNAITGEMAGCLADGSDDTDAIEKGLAYAAANKLRFDLLNEYYIDGKIILNTNSHINGGSRGRIYGNTDGYYYNESRHGLWVNGNNIKIENIKFDSTAISISDTTIKDLTINNCEFTNYSQTGVYGGICAYSVDMPNPIVLKNIIITNNKFYDCAETCIELKADTSSAIYIADNIFRNIHNTTGNTSHIIWAGGSANDSSISVINNKIINISTTTTDVLTGRLWCIAAFGSPLNITGNQFTNISSEYGRGIIAIRGGTINGIISNNVFGDFTYSANGGGTWNESALIMFKGDAVGTDSSNVTISGNNSKNIVGIKYGISILGSGVVSGNKIEMTGGYNITLNALGNPQGCDVVVIGNTIKSYGGFTFGSFDGHHKIIGNQIELTNANMFLSYAAAPDTMRVDFNNNFVLLDSSICYPIYNYGYVSMTGNTFNIKNNTKTNEIIFDLLSAGLDYFKFNYNTVVVDSSVNILSIMRLGSIYTHVYNNLFQVDGSLLSYIYLAYESINIIGNNFDSRGTSDDHAIVYLDHSSMDSLTFANNTILTPNTINSIVHLGTSLADTVWNIDISNNYGGVTDIIKTRNANQRIDTLKYYSNSLTFTNFESGTGSVNTFLHSGNIANTATAGQMLINAGTATVSAGNDSVNVTHQLYYTPTHPASKVNIVPVSSYGSASNYWLKNFNASTFTIKLDAVPGVDVDFNWEITE